MIVARLSEEGRRVVAVAAQRAQSDPAGVVTPTHLLFAVHVAADTAAAQLFAEHGLTAEVLDAAIDEMVRDHRPEPAEVIDQIAFDASARAALNVASQLTRVTNADAGADLIALGVLTAPDDELDLVLTRRGQQRRDLRSALSRGITRSPRAAAPGSTGTSSSWSASSAPRKPAAVSPAPEPAPARLGAANPSRPALDSLTVNLTERARRGELDPVTGRDTEIARLTTVLCRRSKANPVLVGDAGVGKTAVVEGLAQAIVAGQVPARLASAQIHALDVGSLVAGTTYRGDLEKRLKSLVAEVTAAPDVILFIDEIHTLVGAGSGSTSGGLGDLIKPLIARGEMRIIGATTRAEYVRYIEADTALERRFSAVSVDEPNPEAALAMIQVLAPRYEEFHQVTFEPEALRAAVDLSARYVAERRLPDKAVDLLDEAAAHHQLTAHGRHAGHRIDAQSIAEVVRRWTGVPVAARGDELATLRHAEAILTQHVIGQGDAVAALSRALRRRRSGVEDARRPLSVLAVGPSGVGKTHLAREVARLIFGSPDALVRLDMSEYMEEHSVSRLLGSPPGYVGHGEPAQLAEPVRRRPHSLVLIDEIDKAHPRVLDVLLQVLEDGRLTDAQGRVVDFSHAIIYLTANLSGLSRGRTIGFGAEAALAEARHAQHLSDLRKAYRPEFLNRIDQILVFNELDLAARMSIATGLIDEVATRLAERGVTLRVPEAVVSHLAERDYEAAYGARPLRRAVQSLLEDPLAELLLAEGSDAVTAVDVDLTPDGSLRLSPTPVP